jgi:hypothetical protein
MQTTRASERIIEKVITQNGEITVNLNLNITVDAVTGQFQGIQVVPNTVETPEQEVQEKKEKQEFIPDEMFDFNIPVLNNFGK